MRRHGGADSGRIACRGSQAPFAPQFVKFNRSEVSGIIQQKLRNRLEGTEYNAETAAAVRPRIRVATLAALRRGPARTPRGCAAHPCCLCCPAPRVRTASCPVPAPASLRACAGVDCGRVSPQLANELSTAIKDGVKAMGLQRYKLCVHVTLGQRGGQAMRCASRCLWDTSTDNFVSEGYENDTLFATCQVYGLFHE